MQIIEQIDERVNQITDRLNKVLPGYFHRPDGSRDDYAATWRRRNSYAWSFMLETAMLLPEFYYGGPDLAPTILKGYIGLVLTLGLLYNASEAHRLNVIPLSLQFEAPELTFG